MSSDEPARTPVTDPPVAAPPATHLSVAAPPATHLSVAAPPPTDLPVAAPSAVRGPSTGLPAAERPSVSSASPPAVDQIRASAIADLMRAGREASRLSMVFRYAIADRLGLTVSDLECLDFLADAGPVTAGRIAERTNVTTGAVTSMLRRLQQAGWVTAERDPADRRRVIVTLRPERADELERPYERFAERAGRLIEGYRLDELQLLARHFGRLQSMYRAELDHLRGGDAERAQNDR
ncbi:MarR family transcriptional regulator [Actinoplanes sichuanensis]|uniref:MarR family transcriptional regulator n=1 Tax=Actinoplanes sichuanensis TaxID=512349 RepID=A0ABW4AC58_9ACTN|nr:MarR family transcriptional regulator [Actinoplanes sichuanensis]